MRSSKIYKEVEIVKKKKLQKIVLRMKAGHFYLNVPAFLSDEQAYSFIDEHLDWIEFRKKEWQENQIQEGSKITLFDQEYLVVMDSKIFIKNQELHYNKDHEQWQAFLRRFASIRLKERFEAVRQRYRFPMMDLRFGFYSSKWGSCTPMKRLIALNLNLAFVPECCIEAVILHELCHLEHLDHSKAFYASILRRMPDYHERMERLKKVKIPVL